MYNVPTPILALICSIIPFSQIERENQRNAGLGQGTRDTVEILEFLVRLAGVEDPVVTRRRLGGPPGPASNFHPVTPVDSQFLMASAHRHSSRTSCLRSLGVL